MKPLIYIFIIISLTTCKAQKTSTMEQEIIIPQVTKEFETFDIGKFQSHDLSRYDEINENSIIIYTGDKKQSLRKRGFSKGIYPFDSYFMVTKNYFKNGNIEVKGITFNNGSQYGIWYEYDEQGNLVNEINTDAGYDFGWVDVIRYCEKHKIPLTKGYKERSGFQTIIFKKEVDTKKVWEITHQVSGDELEKITLDGKTGEEIKREKIAFINH